MSINPSSQNSPKTDPTSFQLSVVPSHAWSRAGGDCVDVYGQGAPPPPSSAINSALVTAVQASKAATAKTPKFLPNHSANAGNKRVLLWGLHGSALMPGPQSSAISAEAVSSTIRLMATPSTWRRGWKSLISNLAPAFWSVRPSPIGWRTLAADRSAIDPAR
jgi:hypothetical protein